MHPKKGNLWPHTNLLEHGLRDFDVPCSRMAIDNVRLFILSLCSINEEKLCHLLSMLMTNQLPK